MSLKPLDARVVVKKLQRQEQTESGIILPDTVSEQTQTERGTIVAVGPGSKNLNGELMPMSVNVGDKIIFTKFGGTEIIEKDEEFFVVMEKDIIAVVVED
jgi:chaperonin GroES|tara:strand:+ start:1184 stop:1483 length:300 start_codon:yes stop_codon:yes gene_type:complete